MFYCESCRLANGWPKSAMRWNSVCEKCGYYSNNCNDIPSRALPDPEPSSHSDIHGRP